MPIDEVLRQIIGKAVWKVSTADSAAHGAASIPRAKRPLDKAVSTHPITRSVRLASAHAPPPSA